MNFNPEILKRLLATFQEELAENANSMVNELVSLEKNNNNIESRNSVIDNLFRIAHNLKGASRGLGIHHVADIAHQLESVFTHLKTLKDPISRHIIDICLDAVDKMQASMHAFVEKKELNFDINELNKRIETCLHADTMQSSEKEASPKSHGTDMTDAANHKQATEKHVLTDSIRVSLKVVDKLSELSEEIQANSIQLQDYFSHISTLNGMLIDFVTHGKNIASFIEGMQDTQENIKVKKSLHHANNELTNISTAIHKITSDINLQSNDYSKLAHSIQDEVALLRLVPAQNFLSLLPRYIRDLSTELQKNVELEIVGGDVNIDKYVLEGLKDPINHILRNAIDHGIESADARAQAGKPKLGKISIAIHDAGNKIYLKISDDGAGLDYESIKNKIKSNHPEYINKINKLSDAEIEDFIFQPGFSTKGTVTDISGRGVGMDVVKKNIQELKGTITIDSKPGLGTTFTITVPLSLSSEEGVIVESEGQIFVLPMLEVERIKEVRSDEIVSIEGQQTILIDNHPILLKSLSRVLGINQNEFIRDSFPVVILRSLNQVVAFAVDHIIGEREIVIKPLEEPLSNITCVAGATLFDRNKIVIVLNANELIASSLNAMTQNLVSDKSETKQSSPSRRILVVDDSITIRTLEKNILEAHNYEVITAVNGQEAWNILQNQSFALIITDVSMPMMDGFELTKRVKESNKLSRIPVIIVTSKDSDAEKIRGVEVGADAYIIKNEFESSKLLQIIEQLV